MYVIYLDKHSTALSLSQERQLKFRLAANNSIGDADLNSTNSHPNLRLEGGENNLFSTTQFNNNANTVTDNPLFDMNIGKVFASSSAPSQDESIKKFMAKPFIVQTGVLSASDTFSTFASITTPLDVVPSMIKNKLEGYFGFKATSVFTIQLNGNPFQRGRYMLYYIPIGGARSNATNVIAKVASHSNTLRARTQLPRVEFDLNCDTQAQLRVPYVSVHAFVPLVSLTSGVPIAQVASVRLSPYEPIYAPSGSNTCGYTIYHHFEDVELFGAAVPQMGISPTEKEARSAGVGPVEGVAIGISKLAAHFKSTPLLRDYAAPIGWVSDMTARVANFYGWSKPQDCSAVSRMVRTGIPYLSNIDGIDSSIQLGASSKNQVMVLPGFGGTDLDELSIASIASRPANIARLNWQSTNVKGDLIGSFPISLNPVPKTRTVAGAIVIQDLTPAAFCGSLFSYWRGSSVFTFKLIKTKFHSGRMAIAYSPSVGTIGTATTNLDLTQFCWRTIVDIREENIITVRVPFLSSIPYIRTGLDTGVLYVYCVDPIVAPASVGSGCLIQVEHSMGPDVEFAMPKPCNMSPVINATPEMGDPCDIYNGIIGDAPITEDNGMLSAACIGENVSSFRALLRSTNALQSFGTVVNVSKYVNIVPYAISALNVGSTPALPPHSGDLYNVLGYVFNMSRGGMRFKMMCSGTGNYNGFAMISQCVTTPTITENGVVTFNSTDYRGSALGSFAPSCMTGVCQLATSENKFIELSVPSYNATHSRNSAAHVVAQGMVYDTNAWSTANTTRVTVSTPSGLDMWNMVYRGGADDLDLSGFISLPPIYIGVEDRTPI